MGKKRDWRNPQDYEFTKDLTGDGWVWEFLRRNPDYIKEWDYALIKHQIDHKKYRDNLLPKIITLLKKGEGSINLIPGITKELDNDNMSAEERKFLSFYGLELLKEKNPSEISSEGASSRWGFYFDYLINPEIDNPQTDPDLPLFKSFGFVYSGANPDWFPDLNEKEVIIIIDLRKKIEPQLDHFKKLLIEEQNSLKCYESLKVSYVRNHMDNWPSYLRILDAKKENIKNKQIAEVIFPLHDNDAGSEYMGSRKVKDSYKAALKIVNGDYRKVLLTSNKQS